MVVRKGIPRFLDNSTEVDIPYQYEEAVIAGVLAGLAGLPQYRDKDVEDRNMESFRIAVQELQNLEVRLEPMEETESRYAWETYNLESNAERYEPEEV